MTPYTHSPTCTGCPHCNSVFAQLVKASPREQAQFAARDLQRHGVVLTSAPTVAATLTPAQQAKFAQAQAVMAANVAAQAPPVPSLVDAIAARRSGAPLAVVDAPIFGGRPTVAAAQHGDVPEPPSLTEAILKRRTR